MSFSLKWADIIFTPLSHYSRLKNKHYCLSCGTLQLIVFFCKWPGWNNSFLVITCWTHKCSIFFIYATMGTHNIVNKHDMKAQVSFMLISRLFSILVWRLQILQLASDAQGQSVICCLRLVICHQTQSGTWTPGIRKIKEEFKEKMPYSNWLTWCHITATLQWPHYPIRIPHTNHKCVYSSMHMHPHIHHSSSPWLQSYPTPPADRALITWVNLGLSSFHWSVELATESQAWCLKSLKHPDTIH